MHGPINIIYLIYRPALVIVLLKCQLISQCMVENRLNKIFSMILPLSFLLQPLNSNCFKVTVGLKSLSGFLALRQLSKEERLYCCNDWVYWYTIQSVIYNFTMLKGIFNVCFFFTHLPIVAFLCEALENLAGLSCWICAWNVLLNWVTLQIIVFVGFKYEVVIQKSH